MCHLEPSKARFSVSFFASFLILLLIFSERYTVSPDGQYCPTTDFAICLGRVAGTVYARYCVRQPNREDFRRRRLAEERG